MIENIGSSAVLPTNNSVEVTNSNSTANFFQLSPENFPQEVTNDLASLIQRLMEAFSTLINDNQPEAASETVTPSVVAAEPESPVKDEALVVATEEESNPAESVFQLTPQGSQFESLPESDEAESGAVGNTGNVGNVLAADEIEGATISVDEEINPAESAFQQTPQEVQYESLPDNSEGDEGAVGNVGNAFAVEAAGVDVTTEEEINPAESAFQQTPQEVQYESLPDNNEGDEGVVVNVGNASVVEAVGIEVTTEEEINPAESAFLQTPQEVQYESLPDNSEGDEGEVGNVGNAFAPEAVEAAVSTEEEINPAESVFQLNQQGSQYESLPSESATGAAGAVGSAGAEASSPVSVDTDLVEEEVIPAESSFQFSAPSGSQFESLPEGISGIAGINYAGSASNDSYTGTVGDDLLEGGEGDDELFGGPGEDELFGGEGDDFLLGAADDDFISGGAGFNTIRGGAGEDELMTQAGILDGGEGYDLAILEGNVSDYSIAKNDSEDLVFTHTNTGEQITMKSVEEFEFKDSTLYLDAVLELANVDAGEDSIIAA